MSLRDVEEAADRLREALVSRSAAMTTALREGHSVSDIARAARVTRQTVYRLTDAGAVTPGRSDTEVLDAGLGALLEMGTLPVHMGSEITKVIGHPDPLVQARRVQMGAKAAGVSHATATDELQDAMILAGRLLSRRS